MDPLPKPAISFFIDPIIVRFYANFRSLLIVLFGKKRIIIREGVH